MRSIARGSNYYIRSLWIDNHTYNLSFQSFWGVSGFLWGKEWARFEVVHELPCISRGGWANINNGGLGSVVMVKTINICVRLSVWAK